MNPCPCGNYGFKGKNCVCSPTQLLRYQHKISGPILERIDLWFDVPRIEHDKLSNAPTGESSETVRKRVIQARKLQKARFAKEGSSATFNGEMNVRDLVKLVQLTDETKKLLNDSAERLGLSPRVYHKVIKVARTIADLAGSADIKAEHLAEAIQYRSLDREGWGG